MSSAPDSPPPSPVARALVVVGAGCVLWAVLHLTTAGYGTDPHREFAQRRSYNMVKRDVHAAFLGGLTRASAGALLIALGLRYGRRGREG